jgi:hypothetical protein
MLVTKYFSTLAFGSWSGFLKSFILIFGRDVDGMDQGYTKLAAYRSGTQTRRVTCNGQPQ